MKKTTLICSLLVTVSFSAVTQQTNPLNNVYKTVDKSLRQKYYSECKQEKLKNCHMRSFERSVVLRFNKERESYE